eukprot:Nk52_evm45s255 gene=Nk52_evmTU45s255
MALWLVFVFVLLVVGYRSGWFDAVHPENGSSRGDASEYDMNKVLMSLNEATLPNSAKAKKKKKKAAASKEDKGKGKLFDEMVKQNNDDPLSTFNGTFTGPPSPEPKPVRVIELRTKPQEVVKEELVEEPLDDGWERVMPPKASGGQKEVMESGPERVYEFTKDSDLTKKQRENKRKAERKRQERQEEEEMRQARLRAHKKTLQKHNWKPAPPPPKISNPWSQSERDTNAGRINPSNEEPEGGFW